MQCRCVVVGLASGMVGASEFVLTYVPNFGGVSQSRAQNVIHLTMLHFSCVRICPQNAFFLLTV